MGRMTQPARGSWRRVATVGLFAILAVLLCAAARPSSAQWDPLASVREAVDPVADPVVAATVDQIERETGEDLHTEDVAVDLAIDVRNVDQDLVGILFGGGKVGAEGIATLRLDFRAVSATRLDEALRAASGDGNMSLQRLGVPASRMALTAEEIRVVGAGQLLSAFQTVQSTAAKDYLQDTIPGLTVLDLTVTWSNTLPVSQLREQEPAAPDVANATDPKALVTRPPIPPLRDPPLVLEARAHLQYIDRVSLLGILEAASMEDSSDDLSRRIEQNQTDAPLDRNAFRLLGLHQLLAFQVPPGWRLSVTMTVPPGYTIEGATDELDVAADHRSITYRVNGDDHVGPMQQAAIVGLSNRFVVTVTVLVLALLVGFLVRLPAEMAVVHLHYRGWRRAGRDGTRPAWRDRLRARVPTLYRR